MSSYNDLNASLNILGPKGEIQFEKDKEAVKAYFIENINQNTVFFHSLEEKLDYLFEKNYYIKDVFDQYDFKFIKSLYKRAYNKKYRFSSYVGALKFYNQYAMKTDDGSRYLERYEDRVVAVALELAKGDAQLAQDLMDDIISNRLQPATPTFLNAGRARGGERVSCYLIRTEDSMNSISRTSNAALQLSKRGGGVGINLSNLRERGAPIKGVENAAAGVIPVMKILEDDFSYANQLGQRNGSGVVYLHANHPDIMEFLDSKRENADEKIRIKTLSIGVVMPDIAVELARANENMYLFSPYDVERVYGKPFIDLDISALYHEMVDNPQIRKKKISARGLFQTIAAISVESGYPYILFEGNANRANNGDGRINMSNLCVEILQENEASEYDEALNYTHVGKDISCNLASLNIVNVMEHGDLANTIYNAVVALTNVAKDSNVLSVPSIQRGNQETLAIGLGAMNLHGYFAKNKIHYDSEEAIDFTNIFFYTMRYHAMVASNILAILDKKAYDGFEKSKYATGEFFDKYIDGEWAPKTDKVKKIFSKIDVPTKEDWQKLKKSVMENGLRNKYLLAIAPTGSISYVTGCTASIQPVTSGVVEVRKEGKLGRVYYPMPFATNENLEYYKDAFSIGYEKLIDIYAAATEHVDQGISMTMYFPDTATTRDINKAYIYAYSKGIKTIYYIRVKAKSLEGTSVTECVSCSI